MPRKKISALASQPWVPLAEPRGELVEVRVRPQARALVQLLEPSGIALRRLLRAARVEAEPFQVDEPRNALGPRSRIKRGDIATEAVADKVDRLVRRDAIEEEIQVGEI